MANTALITGSYGGLGTCLVNVHAGTGGDVVLVGRDESKLKAQAQEVTDTYGVTAHIIAVDLADPESAYYIYRTCKENKWDIEYIINNAGFGGQGDFARERTMEQDMNMIAVNIEAPTRILKLFLPDMIKRGHGKVLNVSSPAGLMPGPLQSVYYATKAYLSSWSNALWRELQGTGVTVSVLLPGAMNTGFINAGGLNNTKMFENAQSPEGIAKDGYEGMLKGDITVISGLVSWQKPFVALAPMVPKKMMLNFIYDQQVKEKK